MQFPRRIMHERGKPEKHRTHKQPLTSAQATIGQLQARENQGLSTMVQVSTEHHGNLKGKEDAWMSKLTKDKEELHKV